MKITEIKSNGQSQNSQPNRNNENPNIDNQQFEERMFSALDAVCRSSEQSYDEFMSGFTYLKPEHVKQKGSSTSTENIGPPSEFLEFQKKFLRNHSQSGISMNCMNDTNDGDDDTGNLEAEVASSNNTSLYEPEILEEQVLEEGTRTENFLMRPDTITKNLKVKVGNFVDEDEVNDSDCSSDNSYLPSFVRDKKSKNEDLQLQSASLVKPEKNKINNQSSQPTADEKNHLHKTVCSNKEEFTHADLKENLIGQELLQRNLKIQNERSDQSENLLDLIDSCEVDSELSEDLEYDPSLDRLNFGEIGENEETDVINNRKEVNETHLDFKVICDKSKESQDETEQKCDSEVLEGSNKSVEHTTATNEPISDEVEPFQLDEDFDYDNVKLTPKFNTDEMAILMNAVRLGPVYPHPPDEEDNEE